MALTNKIKAIADAIRGKTGKTDGLTLDQMATEIANISATPNTVEQATPSISVSSAGLITASATQTEGFVVGGTKSATKQLSTQGSKTITPGTSNQTAVSSGKYTTGAVTVKGDANLKAANIAKGVSIFGVTGSLESGAKVATGSFFGNGNQPVTVSGLGFKPTKIIIYLMSYNFFGDDYLNYFGEQLLYAEYTEKDGNDMRYTKVVYGGHYYDDDDYCDFVLEPFQIQDGPYLVPTNNGFTVNFTEYSPYVNNENYNYIAIG